MKDSALRVHDSRTMTLADTAFNLNDVAIFVEIAKRGNITRTAELTGIPTATLSRRLRALETGLGVELLSRSTRRIALTESGRLYYDRCRELVEQVMDAHETLREAGTQPRGTLKVLLPDPLDALDFTGRAKAFAEAWPELSYRFDYGSVQRDQREFDVALAWGEQPDSDLIARAVAAVPFRLYASPEYLARHGTPKTPDDLALHVCLGSDVCGELNHWTLQRGRERHELTPQGPLQSNDLEVMRRFCLAGQGIVALPVCDNTPLLPVLPEWNLLPVTLYALFGSRTPPARARSFVDFLMQQRHA